MDKTEMTTVWQGEPTLDQGTPRSHRGVARP